jgi:peptidoglycan/xylan/chitin deacetylase (PgdA/CDA1 family)
MHFGLTEDWASNFIGSVPHLRRFGLLTRPELLQLSAAGMEIASHTLTHPMLSHAPSQLAAEEITQSRNLLEGVLQKPVWALAYPFGDAESVTEREIGFAQGAGYRCAFLNYETPAFSRFAMGRLHMTSDISIPEIRAHLSGFHSALHRLAGAQPALVGKGA